MGEERSRKRSKQEEIIADKNGDVVDGIPAEVWRLVFRSSFNKAEELGSIFLLLSRNLSNKLVCEEEMWATLCTLRWPYTAKLPSSIVNDGFKSLYEMLSRQDVITSREEIVVPPPSIEPSDLMFLINIKKGTDVILSESVSGDNMASLLRNPPGEDHKNDEWWQDDCDASYYGDDEMPGNSQEASVQLSSALHLPNYSSEYLNDAHVTVHLLRTTDKACICILNFPSKSSQHTTKWNNDICDYDDNYEACRDGISLANEVVLDTGRKGDHLLGRMKDCRGSDLMSGISFRLTLGVVVEHSSSDNESDDDKCVDEPKEKFSISHLNFAFPAMKKGSKDLVEYNEYDEDGERHRRGRKKSGVTLLHLLENVSGLRALTNEKFTIGKVRDCPYCDTLQNVEVEHEEAQFEVVQYEF